MDFKVESGIPVPAATSASTGTMYPLDDMKVGDSFLFPITVPDTIKGEKERTAAFNEEAKVVKNRLNGAFGRYRKKDGNANKRFATRSVEGGVRAFRVDDKAPAPAAPKPPAPAAPKPPAAKGK